MDKLIIEFKSSSMYRQTKSNNKILEKMHGITKMAFITFNCLIIPLNISKLNTLRVIKMHKKTNSQQKNEMTFMSDNESRTRNIMWCEFRFNPMEKDIRQLQDM